MKKDYDQENRRLVYFGAAPQPAFWDARWQAADFERAIRVPHNRFIVGNTQRYLPAGARILEGGCGRGDKVYALAHHGYDAYGVDFAPETVARIKQYAPELQVQLGDVRELPFPDGFFDGYWSLGVIEHFRAGYDPILAEMRRVLRAGAYLFLTFPALSPLRALKARLGIYPPLPHDETAVGEFYQFALHPPTVVRHFKANGFELVECKLVDGFYGLMQECPGFSLLQSVYESPSTPARALRVVVNTLTTAWAGHIVLLIFRRRLIRHGTPCPYR